MAVRTLSRSLFSAFVVVTVLSIAGCGGGDNPASPPVVSGAPSPPAVSNGQPDAPADAALTPETPTGPSAGAAPDTPGGSPADPEREPGPMPGPVANPAPLPDSAPVAPPTEPPVAPPAEPPVAAPVPGFDPSLYPARGDSRVGVMGASGDWPLVPIHMAVLPDGRVMSYGREPSDASVMVYDAWDWRGGLDPQSHLTLPNRTGTDLFCSALMLLQSGELLMTGGDVRVNVTSSQLGNETSKGNPDANVYDPSTNQLSRRGQMLEGRWYATMTKLMNGEVFIHGGAIDANTGEVARFTEIGSADGSVFRRLPGFRVDDLGWYYPRSFLSANGQIVGFAESVSYRLDPRGSGARVDTGRIPQLDFDATASAVMFAPGQVLLAGGGNNKAMRADIRGAFPAYSHVPDMSSPRVWGTATVLPDGRVLIANGGDSDTSQVGAPLGNPAQHVDIYDPKSNRFTRGPSSRFPRLYHSTALLLPDATVIVAGGGLPGPVTNRNAEIWYPPYLFAADGSLARRPVIAAAPQVLNAQQRFAIESPDAGTIASVVLVKTGAVTHSFDMDQRRVELAFERSGNTLDVSMPAQPGDTPPGFYHVFVLDAAGVPSISHIARLNTFAGTLPEAPPAGLATAGVGAQAGSRHELYCAPGETLVGIHGNAADRINRLGPVCAEAGSTGGWTATPVDRPAVGDAGDAVGAGPAFRRVCAVGQAVSGFAGNADAGGRHASGLVLKCRALSGSSLTTGTATWLTAVGAPAAASIDCPADKPAAGVIAHADGDFYHGFALRCAY